MIRGTLTMAAFAGCLMATSAFAGDLCRVEAFGPGPVYKEVLRHLPGAGVAALPPAVLSGSLPLGRTTLVRGGAVVGQITYAADPRDGTAALVVADAAGKTLMAVRDTRQVCLPPFSPAGLCRELTASTSLQPPLAPPPSPPAAPGPGRMPWELMLGPDDAELPAYTRYGTPVDFYTYQHSFLDALAWLNATLATTQVVAVPQAATPELRGYWALAADPFVAPYLPRLTFTYGYDKGAMRLVVHGVVPSDAVYGQVIDDLARAGFPSADPDLIIDTRTALPPDTDPVVLGCYGP
jgi:hypothetical protein